MSEEEILEARRAYFREWKKNNPDKVRESNRKYWAKYAEKRRNATLKKESGS